MDHLRAIFQLKIKPMTRARFYSVAVGIGLTVALVLIVFQPFGTYTFDHQSKYLILMGYGIVISLAALVLYEFLTLIRPSIFKSATWTFGREMALIFGFFLFSVVMSYFYHHQVIGGRLSLKGFMYFFTFASSVGLIPLCFVFLFAYQKAKAQLLMEGNIESPQEEALVHLEGANKNESILVKSSQLILLTSSDNYVEIILAKDGRSQKHLIRSTLSNLTEQLGDHAHFYRVHRSYLINTSYQISLSGKSPAYVLHFADFPELGEIPVARQNVESLKKIIAEKPL